MKKATAHVPKHVREQVEAEVRRCIEIARDRFDRDFDIPEITYDLRGTTAGYAFCQENRIQLNSVLLMENLETFIDGRVGRGTVTHEVAHIVDYIGHNGFRRRGSKRSVHGNNWKHVMRMFGVRNPTRCHSYDTKNAQVRKRVRHEYRCNGCGEIMTLGPKQHKKQQNPLFPYGSDFSKSLTTYWKRGCGRHAKKTGYTYLGLKGRQEAVLKAANAPAPKKGTKKEKAIATYREFSHMPKDFIISKIANECNMSWQGATTYFYTARKEA